MLLRNWLSANGYLRTASTIDATAAAAIAAPDITGHVPVGDPFDR